MNRPTPNLPKIWVIDDDQSIRWILERALTNAGFDINAFETASKALTQFKRVNVDDRPALILTDFRMPGINGFELLKQINNIDPTLPVIIMTAYSDLDTTVQAYQEGAFEYLAKPFDIDDAIDIVSKAYRQAQINTQGSNNNPITLAVATDWKQALQLWADNTLANGESNILTNATKELEKILIDCALSATGGRKQLAAKRLGWGRNTLTRKLKEYRQ